MIRLAPIVDRSYDSHVRAWDEAGRLGMIDRRNRRDLAEVARTSGERRRRRVTDIVAAIMADAA
jgi:hypothetical protein